VSIEINKKLGLSLKDQVSNGVTSSIKEKLMKSTRERFGSMTSENRDKDKDNAFSNNALHVNSNPLSNSNERDNKNIKDEII